MEVEAKYRIMGDIDAARIESVDLSPYVVIGVGEDNLQDELLDTDGHGLAANGFALRRRRSGSGTVATLKGAGTVDGALHSRSEVEVPLIGDDWPAEIWSTIAGIVGEQPLTVVSRVINHRRSWLVQRDGEPLAELVLDRGEITAGGLTEQFHEIEIEAKAGGSADDVVDIGARLAQQLPLEPEGRSKFGRGLALLAQSQRAPEAPTVDPTTRPMLDVGRDVVLLNLDRLLAAGPSAREGSDHEGVHQLRVATRRLRAALQVLEETVADPAVTRAFRRQLRGLANSAGLVRDADVFEGNLDRYARDLDEEEQAGLGPLRDLIAARRQRGRKDMIKSMDAKATRRLLAEIRRWAARGAGKQARMVDTPEPVWVRHFVRSTIWRRYEEMLAYETVMPAPVPILHRLRVTAKRCRYTIEFFEDALGTDGKWVLKRLAGVQDHLGQLQDADVAIEAIDEVARARHGTAALQTYRDLCRNTQLELAASFGKEWDALTDASFRQRLSDVLLGI